MNNAIVVATYTHWIAVYTKALANLNIYFESPVAIGEHSDLVAETVKLSEQAANARDVIEELERLHPWLKDQKLGT